VTANISGTDTIITFTVADGKNYDCTFQLAPPAAPTGLSATTLSGTRVRLTWTDASDDETGFLIERSTGGGPFSTIQTTAADVTSYEDSGLLAGTTYSYRVRATNANGESVHSSETTTTTWTALQAWRDFNFAVTEPAGNSTDAADPDGDGLPNLVEFALGNNPLTPEPDRHPVLSADANELSLTFVRKKSAAGVLTTIQTSLSLAPDTWTSDGVTFNTITEDAATQTVRGSVPNDTPKRFLRLRTTQVP